MASPMTAALMLPEPPARKLPQPRTTPYAPEKQARLRAEMLSRSAAVVAAEAGFSLNTLTSLASGNGCNESTKRLADVYLAARDSA